MPSASLIFRRMKKIMRESIMTPRRLSMAQRAMNTTSPKQRGATLIEILVAVLVLSFGLLGMAALQTRAVQGNQSSLQRSQAIMLNNSIMDAMRIDRESAKGGSYQTANVCGPAGISGASLANNNIRDWLTAAQNNMTGAGGAAVCGTISCTVNYVCTVSLTWDDSKAGGLPLQTLTVEGKL
jgi:type IV pilus assembly protein PilV